MESALYMAEMLYRAVDVRPQWDTAGASLPISFDVTTDEHNEQCGVLTASGACLAKVQHPTRMCPTHVRIASKYTCRYHACTKIVVHSSTAESALVVLRYVVALRTVVYMMYRDAAAHKNQFDDEAETHAMPINYFEQLIRTGAGMPVNELINAVQNVPKARDLDSTIPETLQHFLVEPHIQRDLMHDADAEDVVNASDSLISTAPSTSTARAKATQRRCARSVMPDTELQPYPESGTEVIDPALLWLEFLKRIDDGKSTQLVLAFPYHNRELKDALRLTGTAITYLYDACTGEYTFGSDFFYATEDTRVQDYQTLRLLTSYDENTTAVPLSVKELLSPSTARVLRNDQRCFLLSVTATNANEHRVVRAYILNVLFDLRNYKNSARALLDVHAVEKATMSRRMALRFPTTSKRLLSHTDAAIKRTYEGNVINGVQRMQTHRGLAQIEVGATTTLVKRIMREDVDVITVRSTVRYLVGATQQTVPEILRLQDMWWSSQPISTLHVQDKFTEQTLQYIANSADLLRQARSNEAMLKVVTAMEEFEMELLKMVQQQITKEMEKTPLESPAVLVSSEIAELNTMSMLLLAMDTPKTP